MTGTEREFSNVLIIIIINGNYIPYNYEYIDIIIIVIIIFLNYDIPIVVENVVKKIH